MEREVLPPGFRFHPTDEELVLHYLKRKSCAGKFEDGIIGEVDLYSHEPWDLPEKSALCSRDPEWYFFNARDKKYPHGSRTNRATKDGYWKGTGKDRSVCSGGCTVGMKKTLVYYLGRAPNGERTDWIMHEYRLDEEFEKRRKILSNFVLCRIRKKSGPGPRNGEQYGAPVLDEENEIVSASECISGDVTNEALPRLYENNDQQEHANVSKKPGFRGCFETSSNEMDWGGMEGLNSGEELEAFLQDLLSNESQDEFAVEGHESKAQILSAAYFDDEAGSSSVDHSEHSGSLEPLQSSSMQALSRSPNLSGVYFHGLENLHNVLHPAPDEAEILGEVLQALAAGGDVTYHSANSSVDQNEGILSQALAQNQDLVRNDYLEFVGPPENLLFTLPELETTGFETSEEEGSPCSEDLSIEIRSHSKRIQEELHGHGTAAWRARLQLPPLPSLSQHTEGSINDKDTLHQPEALYALHGQSPFSEVSVLTHGGLKDVLSVELHDTVDIDGSSNEDITFTRTPLDFGWASNSESSVARVERWKDAPPSHQIYVEAVPNCDAVPAQLFQAEKLPVTALETKGSHAISANTAVPTTVDFDGDAAFDTVASNNRKATASCRAKSEGVLYCSQSMLSNLGSAGPPSSDGLPCHSLGLADICMESSSLDLSSTFGDSYSVTSVRGGQADCTSSASLLKKHGVAERSKKQENYVDILSDLGQDVSGCSLNVEQVGYIMASPESSSEDTNSQVKDGVTALEAHPGFSSASSLSSHELPKSLVRILNRFGNVSVFPAWAAELSVDLGNAKAVFKKPWASATCSCAKNEAEYTRQALPVGSSSSSASPGVINKMHLSVHSNKWLQYKCECRSTATSNYKMRKLGVFVTWIISITDHIRLFRSLSGDFRVLVFWLPISVLSFLYPFQGFWRLAKRALANFGPRTVM